MLVLGGGLTAAFGIVAALLERERSGHGQVIDSNLVSPAFKGIGKNIAFILTRQMRCVFESIFVNLLFYIVYESMNLCTCAGVYICFGIFIIY